MGWTGGHVPSTFRSGGHNVSGPPYFLEHLLNNDRLAHPLNVIMHSKTHLICLAAGLASDLLGGELTALARHQLLATESGV